MKAALLGALALVAGCVLFAEPRCDESACPDGFACRPDGACHEACDSDAQCVDGFYCQFRECEPKCVESECGGYACDTTWEECFDDCFRNAECAKGFFCCTTDRESDGQCELNQLFECVRR